MSYYDSFSRIEKSLTNTRSLPESYIFKENLGKLGKFLQIIIENNIYFENIVFKIK